MGLFDAHVDLALAERRVGRVLTTIAVVMYMAVDVQPAGRLGLLEWVMGEANGDPAVFDLEGLDDLEPRVAVEAVALAIMVP